MKIIKKIYTSGFTGTYSEYLECKKLLKKECSSINKNPLYLLGLVLFIFSFSFLLSFFNNKFIATLLLVILISGVSLITQAGLNYYYNFVNREREKGRKIKAK